MDGRVKRIKVRREKKKEKENTCIEDRAQQYEKLQPEHFFTNSTLFFGSV